MSADYHFGVYVFKIVLADSRLIERKLIVIRNQFGDVVQFTDFHRYCRSSTRTGRSIEETGNNRHAFACKFLNYIYIDRRLASLDDLSIELIQDFISLYGCGALPDDNGKKRTKQTVNQCISSVLDFVKLYIRNNQTCSLREQDLVRKIKTRNKNGKVVEKDVPVFDYQYDTVEHSIFRDMPEKVVYLLLQEIAENHKDILMLVALQAFAGLRPSEACNVRRADANPKGIYFNYVFSSRRKSATSSEVSEIGIDLTHERILRSDLVSTGRIKKERMQYVYPAFINTFCDCYNAYMEHIEGREYEAEFAPLSINKQGKAYTYSAYKLKLKEIVKSMIPTFLSDEDPKVVSFGHMMLTHSVAPHIFRHWFTVQLILHGEDNPSQIQRWRGDRSPTSALTYLQNKSELEEQYQVVNDELSEFILWRAKNLMVQNGEPKDGY